MKELDPFISYAQKYIELSESELDALRASLPVITVLKGEYLLKQGEVSDAFYFVLEGCVRLYYDVEGEDKSAFFYQEHTFVSSFESFIHQKSAEHNLQCVEDCVLVKVTWEVSEKLLSISPKFDALARIILESELGLYQRILASFITLSPEQRYQKFLDENPLLMQRIPQRYIASYLGVSAETLSRIKKRIIEKSRKS